MTKTKACKPYTCHLFSCLKREKVFYGVRKQYFIYIKEKNFDSAKDFS